MESLNLQVVAVLMPLEIKHNTVPHLKALIRSIQGRIGHGHGGTFISAILLRKVQFYFINGPNGGFM